MNKSEILTPENIDKILMIVYDSDVEKVLTINRAEFKKTPSGRRLTDD